jgi:hypothetical protein
LEFWIMVLLQHLAATLALDPRPELAATEARDLAARLAGFVDKRMLELDVTREFTEEQEHDRMLAALTVILGAESLAARMADGAQLNEERAVNLASPSASGRSPKEP